MTREPGDIASRSLAGGIASSGANALPEIDALRGIAIVAVIGLHVSFGFLRAAPAGSRAGSYALGIHLLTSFGTPLFIALSMVGLTLGYGEPCGVGRRYWTFLARRAGRILPAYVFWTVLTLLRNDPGLLLRPTAVAGVLLTGSAAYHLYFVPLICEYYLLWPLLSVLAAWARRDRAAAIAIAAGGLGVSLAVWHAASLGVPITTAALPLFWLGYATLGIAVAPALPKLFADGRPPQLPRLSLLALVVVTAAWMLAHVRALLGPRPTAGVLAIVTTIFQPPVMAYTVAAMALCLAAVTGARRYTRGLQALGRRSYGVYLAHVLVLEVVLFRVFGRPATAGFDSPAWVIEMLAEWAACLGVTFAVVCALERVPGLAVLAGSRPPARR